MLLPHEVRLREAVGAFPPSVRLELLRVRAVQDTPGVPGTADGLDLFSLQGFFVTRSSSC
ncbi:MAG TPA: hypothetical protein DIT48_09180 [Actinobacteria bacterium]|nr:hypothetical protein [Actinomycetota bacterium]